MKKNALNWFEIHVADLARAKRFYDTILDTTLQTVECETGCQMAIFPHEQGQGIGGALTKMDECGPAAGGTVVYLNVEGDLDGVLSRVVAAGGKIVRERMAIPPHGFIGIIGDTEGNVVGLHSMV
ncbi:VOC family protein [Luteolibacter ambystomatis]|uniref:VOC family protein n=1 Tax=Luteolibacter ambystomatis TaxID=2824561 RepID=A0A975IZ71_9BACT|nr:VOC family protein [Luteolibacter ambystomatis]QUE50879.1 VOC family protein [Luteolibacter ambystomatis]